MLMARPAGVEALALGGGVPLLVAAMVAHPRADVIQCLAAGALHVMCARHAERVRAAGAACAAAASSCGGPVLRRETLAQCVALLASAADPGSARQACEAGGARGALAFLQDPARAEDAAVALEAWTLLASAWPPARSEAGAAGALSVAASMRAHPACALIQARGCEALRLLAPHIPDAEDFSVCVAAIRAGARSAGGCPGARDAAWRALARFGAVQAGAN
jgi:hypothetical protein